MGRLIDAEKLIENITGVEVCWYIDGDYTTYGDTTIVDIIDKQATIEAVHVVRCKDCKHWGTGVAGETERIKCCEYGRYMVGENGYCVYGEKKV